MIPLFKVYMSKESQQIVSNTLQSGFLTQGPRVEEFEKDLSSFVNNENVVTVNSATSGLHLAIHLLKQPNEWNDGLKEGDEILCTPLTCAATNWPVLSNNLNIKWVDVDPNTLNMDLDDLEKKITPKTKAILFVHWGGFPIDLERVTDIQQNCFNKFGFKPAVIEDCAHAFGSHYNEKHLGNHGNICVFSFQAIKHLTCGDGGMVIFPNSRLAKQAKLIRWFGIDREHNSKDFRCEADIPNWGFKFHMNDINASIGIGNLKSVKEEVINKHKANSKYFDNHLTGISGVDLLKRNTNVDSSSWIYSFLVDNKTKFMEMMKANDIMVSQVHERNDIHSCVKQYKTDLPNLDKVVKRLISIPVGWWLSEEDKKTIVGCIRNEKYYN